jgi:pimeloyl-ACP methyl ester carboxylesterase
MELSRLENRSLVVILHAYTMGPDDLRHIRKSVLAERPLSHILCPQLPLQMYSTAEPTHLALKIVREIDLQTQHREQQGWEPFEEIVLIGHSLGALLVRKVYVIACGDGDENQPGEKEGRGGLVDARPWSNSVRRIILFAAMNRGWSITHHLNISTAAQLYIGSLFGNALLSFLGKRLIIFQIRRGAPFLTNLRLQWIAMQKRAIAEGRRVATTIQLLGTVDDLVAPDDNIDLTTGRDFLYLDVPASGHVSVIQLDDTDEGTARRRVFQLALNAPEDEIRSQSRPPSDPTLAQVRRDVTNVIFVIHGIRDAGYWTQRIARKVESLGGVPPRIYASQTSTYGYFPMLPFLLPSRRRAKVEWLMDQYVEAKVLYPNADFSYFGHSNGTYLAARAFELYPACRFSRVVFAGSVVRKNYDWREAIQKGQVGAILNYVASADWVVAWFPGALEMLRLQDLGTAGHNGFAQARTHRGIIPLFERSFLRGQHGAALVEKNWDDIADFIVNGIPNRVTPVSLLSKRNGVVVALGVVSPLLWLVLFAILLLASSAIWTQPFLRSEWQRTLVLVGFWWVVWKVLTWI